MSNRILLVDDEPAILKIYEKSLGGRYELELANSGAEALEMVETNGPFAVVISDMEMPDMSGAELLKQIRAVNRHTVRMMMTGHADAQTAIQAVNEGYIFRFLDKPCTPEKLSKALDEALQKHQLVTAEAELLNSTVAGSIRMLTQVLSLVMPEAFGLTQEAKNLARSIAEKLGAEPLWQIEMAAMLMRIGCVSLPNEVLTKYLKGEELNPEQMKLVREAPEVGYDLVRAIPRLQGVAELIRAQNAPPTNETQLGARILRVVDEFQRLQNKHSPVETLKRLQDESCYDPDVVNALSDVISVVCNQQEVMISELREGMILNGHIEQVWGGGILIAKGSEVHAAMIQRLNMLRRDGVAIREPVRVRICRSQADGSLQQDSDEPQPAAASQPA